MAATSDRQYCDPVTLAHRRHFASKLDYFAGKFMSQYQARECPEYGFLGNMQISPADAATADFDQYVAGPWNGVGHFLHRQRLPECLEHSGSHGVSSPVSLDYEAVRTDGAF
jgi:hypothetical protein